MKAKNILSLSVIPVSLFLSFVSIVFVLSAFIYKPLVTGIFFNLAICFIGTIASGTLAYLFPHRWLLFPILFGVPVFLFGIGAGFNKPDPSWTALWESIAVSFLIFPLAGSYLGRKKKVNDSVILEKKV